MIIKRLSLEAFIGSDRPCWIQHRYLDVYCGWAMFYAEQYPLIKVDYIRVGRVMLAPDKYGISWVALDREPTAEEAIRAFRR
ncbi:MAG: hypothetical protein IKM82_00825 [Oscillospiraceae bacterium]|nr:hypothetical protein [Oscillospiraceae bacterium]MBR4636262.1 hypothetical protein [Clostridia bacterium]MBR6839114.1 hypothetical protein [Oscillospiraceae bacterium]